jgi:hypothetical protein
MVHVNAILTTTHEHFHAQNDKTNNKTELLPNAVVMWLIFLLHIREVTRSSLGTGPAILTAFLVFFGLSRRMRE